MELFLPWWFDHIQKHNTLPVAIIDYGLSEFGKRVAQNIGLLIEKKPISIDECQEAPSKAFPTFRHEARKLYMYKPFGLASSPFEHTIWLDVDCKVRCDLTQMFDTPGFKIALTSVDGQKWAQEHQVFSAADTPLFNTGVLVVEKNSPVLQSWCNKTLQDSASYVLEDVLLSELIATENLPITILPSTYNTHWKCADTTTKIVHFMNHYGKAVILQEMLAKVCGVKDEG